MAYIVNSLWLLQSTSKNVLNNQKAYKTLLKALVAIKENEEYEPMLCMGLYKMSPKRESGDINEIEIIEPEVISIKWRI